MRNDVWDNVNRRERRAAAMGRYFRARYYQAQHLLRWSEYILSSRAW